MDDNSEDGFGIEENYYAFLNISTTVSVPNDFFYWKIGAKKNNICNLVGKLWNSMISCQRISKLSKKILVNFPQSWISRESNKNEYQWKNDSQLEPLIGNRIKNVMIWFHHFCLCKWFYFRQHLMKLMQLIDHWVEFIIRTSMWMLNERKKLNCYSIALKKPMKCYPMHINVPFMIRWV